ncbi:hypothetical protein H0N95_03040 [Candidatus Micrarchaeota archaeon]|nr:hypothetical protein [Candidatus Micrarchaeota archaeon]
MQKMQTGKITSFFNAAQITRALNDLKRTVKGLTVELYEAKMPISTTLWFPMKAKKTATLKRCNYIIVKRRGKRVLDFYGSQWRGNAHIYDENLTPTEYFKAMHVLARHSIFTFEMYKQYHYVIRYFMVLLSFLLVLMAADLIFLTNEITPKIVGLWAAVFGMIIMQLYVK